MTRIRLACTSPFLLFAAFTVGCVARRTTVPVQYVPTQQSPLANFPSRTVALYVVDERPVDQRGVVSRFDASVGGLGTNLYVTEKPVPDLLRGALVHEFERSGHRIASGANSNADVEVRVFLTRFWVLPSFGTDSELAEVNAEISMQHGGVAGAGRFPISGFCKSSYPRNRPHGWDPSKDVSGALSDFILNLTLDSRLLDAFR